MCECCNNTSTHLPTYHMQLSQHIGHECLPLQILIVPVRLAILGSILNYMYAVHEDTAQKSHVHMKGMSSNFARVKG